MGNSRIDALAWLPVVSKAAGPLYLAIADALAADIQSGVLTAGTRLPAQRTLAEALGIDFTTVSRAYSEARDRGLVEGRVGQGTYVRMRRSPAQLPMSGGQVDLSMNLPPRFEDAALCSRIWSGIRGLEASAGIDILLRYQEPGGSGRDRSIGAQWLAPRLPGVSAKQVLIFPGAQSALFAVTGALAAPGETVMAEPLTYPGFLSLAANLGVQLVSVPTDAGGPIPEAFDRLCGQARPKAYYCNPTINNPTTRTIPLERRETLLSIARAHNLYIIEDDAYGALPTAPVPPFAAIAPDLVYHVAGLSKCLSPALRVCYLVVPDPSSTVRLASRLRATALMASPLTVAMATAWIEDGTANAVLSAIRLESKARQAIAARLLPAQSITADGFHIWLSLTPPWTRGEFTARLGHAGIGVVASDAFATNTPPEAVRLGLGAPANRAALTQSLQIVADLLGQSPAQATMVV